MRWSSPLLAALSLLLFVGVMELVLWTAGARTLAEGRDPFEGFSEQTRVFSLDRERDVYETSPSAKPFNRETFAAQKPAEGLRVFALGGSSAYGFPWDARVAFPNQLLEGLRAVARGRPIEVVNAAAMSYASHRLRILTRELLDYEPDVLVVYSGHNEFVERHFYGRLVDRSRSLDALRRALHHSRLYSSLTRLYQSGLDASDPPASDEFDLVVNRSPPFDVTAAEKEEVRARFEANLRAILEMARGAGVRVVLCTVPSNVRDWAPEQSGFEPGVPAEDQSTALALQREAERALERNDAGGALAVLEQAIRLSPGYARLHFQMGRAFEALERWEEARSAYVRARDLDGSPIRALTSINDTIRRLAEEEGIPLVDVERIFEAEATHGLLSFEHFEDYVHPKPAAHQRIGLALWTLFLHEGLLGADVPTDAAIFEAAVSRAAERRASQGRRRPRERAVLLFNTGVVLANQGHDAEALEKFRAAADLAPGYAAPRLNIGTLLARDGHHEEAVIEFREALRIRPNHVRTLLLLGNSLGQLARHEEAIEVLEAAMALDPENENARRGLEMLRAR
jgi:tetratricopeptide (TPR) repeat protein